jgi:thiamine transport system substrate-binding protein
VSLPPAWAKFAPTSPRPYAVDPADVTAKRATWLREWRDLTSR